MYLDQQFPEDTVLIIEPLSPDARTLLARVVRVDAKEGGWMHGCSLPTRLDAEELGGWLGHDVVATPETPQEAHCES